MKKKSTIVILLFIVVALSIGFALLSTTLKINGIAGVNKHTWDIHWENVDNQAGVTPVNEATINPSDNTEVNFEADFTIPGDYYEFTVDAVNRGDLDGMLQKIETTVNGTSVDDIADYLSYSIKYADGTTPEENDLLAAGKLIPYKVRLEYKRTITNEQLEELPDDGEPYSINVKITYIQANDNAVDKGNTTVLSDLKLGDYFTLVPDAETATTNVAGFSGSTPTADQTLWRVIDIHNDGTVDAVSEYISTSDIVVGGINVYPNGNIDGYKNYIAGLQDVASKYAKSGYTVGTRMMGYDGQTSTLSDTSYYDGTVNTVPSASDTPTPTTGTGQEYSDGLLGDTLYLKDYQLVSEVYKTDTATYGNNGLRATDKTGYNDSYWLASRKYLNMYTTGCSYNGRFIYDGDMYSSNFRYFDGDDWDGESYDGQGERVRPIITLKSGITIASGTGIKNDPYIFE